MRILREGETAVVESGVWHDWWNAAGHDIRVRIEITPGERFLHMLETFFGPPPELKTSLHKTNHRTVEEGKG